MSSVILSSSFLCGSLEGEADNTHDESLVITRCGRGKRSGQTVLFFSCVNMYWLNKRNGRCKHLASSSTSSGVHFLSEEGETCDLRSTMTQLDIYGVQAVFVLVFISGRCYWMNKFGIFLLCVTEAG